MRASHQRLRRALLQVLAALPLPAMPSARGMERQSPRILLIRPDHIGDLLFATPALRLLRRAYPGAHLAALIGPWGKAVLEHNPNLDEIIVCEFPAFTRRPKASFLAPYRLLWQWATRLRSQLWDMALVLRFDHWWGALLVHLARIPQRVGYAIPECRPFLSQAVPYESHHHEVEQNLRLVQVAVRSASRDMPQEPLCLEFPLQEQDRAWTAQYLTERGVGHDERLIAIHPGAGAPVKQWLPEAWARVGDTLAASCQARILITGSRDELDLAWSVATRMRCEAIVAAGDTSLSQLAALFERCCLVMGPDCGPLHLAVAMGTPTVHLYGPVDVHKFGPWGPFEKHVVLTSGRSCIPCNRLDYSAQELAAHPCVRDIPAEQVIEAAQTLLAKCAE